MQPKSFLSLIAASLMLSSLSSFAAKDRQQAVEPIVIGAPAYQKLIQMPSLRTCGLVFAATTAYQLYSRISVSEKNWESRFSLDTLKDFTKIGTKAYLENLWYLYQDKFVGQCYKSKSIKLGGSCSDDHRLQVHSDDCLAHGVCGNIDLKLKALSKSMEGLSSLLITYFLLNQYGVAGLVQQKLNAVSKDIGNPHNADTSRPVVESVAAAA